MQILKQACGALQTNCYIINSQKGSVIIDPGDGAFDFVLKNAKNPLAILNTHGHYDHIWDNNKIKKHFNIPLYIHKNDAFFLEDIFNQGFEKSQADVLIEDEKEFQIADLDFKFHFFPGHTPGSCMIELAQAKAFFSGDFLFYRSIGRYDLPYSDARLMKESLQKVLKLKLDFHLYPGHGEESSLKAEQEHLPTWLKYF